jgi:hypothetical protein
MRMGGCSDSGALITADKMIRLAIVAKVGSIPITRFKSLRWRIALSHADTVPNQVWTWLEELLGGIFLGFIACPRFKFMESLFAPLVSRIED